MQKLYSTPVGDMPKQMIMEQNSSDYYLKSLKTRERVDKRDERVSLV
jgi:hypothetical protein